MSTIISGNNISYTASQLIDINANEIIRTPTAASFDNFAVNATDLINAFIGTINAEYDGTSFTLTIQNNSAFAITQTCTGTNVTMGPDTSVVIAPYASVTFTFLQEDGTIPSVTVDIINSRAVFAPSSSTDSAIVLFDGTSGNLIKNSVVTIDNNGNISDVNSIIFPGSTSGSVTIEASAVVTTYTLTLPPNSGSAGQFLTTDGTGVTTWITSSTENPKFYGFGPAVSVPLSGTFATVNIVSSIADANYSNTDGAVTITNPGTYEFIYTAQFESLDNSGGATGSFAGQLLLDAAVVGGSITECFVLESNGDLHRPSCSKTVYSVVTAGQTLSLQVARTAGTTTGQTRVNQCTLAIIQLA